MKYIEADVTNGVGMLAGKLICSERLWEGVLPVYMYMCKLKETDFHASRYENQFLSVSHAVNSSSFTEIFFLQTEMKVSQAPCCTWLNPHNPYLYPTPAHNGAL